MGFRMRFGLIFTGAWLRFSLKETQRTGVFNCLNFFKSGLGYSGRLEPFILLWKRTLGIEPYSPYSVYWLQCKAFMPTVFMLLIGAREFYLPKNLAHRLEGVDRGP
jgi:hypothetical protein